MYPLGEELRIAKFVKPLSLYRDFHPFSLLLVLGDKS